MKKFVSWRFGKKIIKNFAEQKIENEKNLGKKNEEKFSKTVQKIFFFGKRFTKKFQS